MGVYIYVYIYIYIYVYIHIFLRTRPVELFLGVFLQVTCEGIRSGAIIAARIVGEPRVHLQGKMVRDPMEENTNWMNSNAPS